MEEFFYDVIIVGAGPAGLTSALYLLRANKNILILEKESYGGQILNAKEIQNYPGILSISGYDFATNLYHQVKNLSGNIKYETVLRVEKDKTVITEKNKYQANCVILATGSSHRKLNIAQEKDFLGKGVSYCATCDGNFYKGKKVAVLGGGNTAIEDALYLSDIVSKVYLIHRKSEFRADNTSVEELKKKENVIFLLNRTVVSLNGQEKLESIDLEKEKTKETIEVEGLFIAIGQEPKNEIFQNVVDLDEKGYIISEDGVHTKTKGILVAGDTRVKTLRQLTTAVSDGSIAATTAIREINEKE